MSQAKLDAPSNASNPVKSWLLLSSRQRMVAGFVVIILAIWFAYQPALHGGFLWDDDDLVTRPELRSLSGLSRIWLEVGAMLQYYPVVFTAFWAEHRLWGDNPLGYHLANVLWHAISAGLLYLILRKLRAPGAYLAAAIFALHPVMVESVAWISEQKNTLSTMFYLGALLTYLHFDETRKRSLYAAALVLFALALFSKTTTVTLPAALLVILWWQRGRLSWQRDVLPLVPWFIFGAAAGLITVWAERKYVGAEGDLFELSIVQRGLLAGRVVWFYLGKLLCPTNLIFIYPRWEIDAKVWWQWLFPAATVAMFVALWMLRRKWRSPLAAWLFFVGTLFPALGFFNVYPFVFSFVADHFQYLASLGMIALGAGALALAARRLPEYLRPLGPILGVLLVGTLGALTWQQCQMYGDIETLYRTTIDRNPSCWMAHTNLSAVLTTAGRTDEAMEHCYLALAIRPNNPGAYNNLGAALAKSGRLEEAIPHFQHALQLKPDYPEAFTNLGIVLGRLGRIPEAVAQFQQALTLDPNYADAHSNLGLAYFKDNQPQEAIDQFEAALRLQPNNAKTHFGLAGALALEGRFQDAVEHYRQGLQLNPQFTEACFHLAETYAQMQQPTQAIAAAQQAIDLARSQGQSAQESQIQEWLDAYRAQSQSRP